MSLSQKDGSDWMAFLIVLAVFVALAATLIALGTHGSLPFIGKP